jgi:2-amino-4-hydroxy-6-hydroxymethyldihydropteridine diphosphokinase
MALGADTIVLGLGGNVGGDDVVLARMRAVRDALAAWGRVRAAPVYRTAPVGGPPQPDFLNTALAVDARPPPTPRELIESVQELERLCGRMRDREVRWGPRTLDLDVLLWGARVIDDPGPPWLRVPHPELARRRFALAPVIDLIGEEAIVPGDGRTLRALLDATGDQHVERTELAL